ncbi:MAG TPA: hydroxymethylbilane synthase [Pyrinomonadaceae bacterium]|jgi:hydroxymethylbilane synthase|nr:hydroxymethylbilane synthase [Pyrinomonadaceae bacterium]
MRDRFIIGSRGSDLALWQTKFVKSSLEHLFPEIAFEIKIITTTGDKLLDVALSKIGDKGLFTQQIEAELFSGEIDLAVHSLKDLQTSQPDGLTIGAVCERELPNDAFISDKFDSISDLPIGARVATGSLRRRSQLLNLRPDIEIVEIRGNVPTRLRKFAEAGLDAMILAYAGLHRLGLDSQVKQVIPFDEMLPAVGQGAVAVEVRADNTDAAELVSEIDHKPTRVCVAAERALLRTLEGGCQVPIGANAQLENDRLRLSGFVGSLDGKVVFRESDEGSAEKAEQVGVRLAEKLITLGARELLDETRAKAVASSESVM